MQKIKTVLMTALASTLMFFSFLPAGAQQAPGSGLSVSPTLTEYNLKPGQANVLTITLKNITSNDIVAKGFVNDFESDNLTGSPRIITDPNKHSEHSIKGLVQAPEDVPLVKGQQKKINLAVQIPSDTTPGAYYGVVRYKAVPVGTTAPQNGEVSLSASVGTIVLISVPGNVRTQAQLKDLHVYSGNNEETLFITHKPTQVGIEVKNLGNSFVKPFGTVEVQNMRGKEIYNYQLNAGQQPGSILPGSTRIFKNALKNVSTPGRYTVTANITYGNGSQILTQKKTFWYIPLWLTIVLGVLLVVLIVWIVRAITRRRSKR